MKIFEYRMQGDICEDFINEFNKYKANNDLEHFGSDLEFEKGHIKNLSKTKNIKLIFNNYSVIAEIVLWIKKYSGTQQIKIKVIDLIKE